MGDPTNRTDRAFDALNDRLRGTLFRAGQSGYDRSRRLWNARVDDRPRVIVRCRGVADVMAAVEVASRLDLPVSAKGGGHHVGGMALPPAGLMLDLGPMDDVRVDRSDGTVRVGPGATWRAVDRETQAFGLAVPGGQDPNIGVAGLTLGGGVGWLSRRYGLTCDNLASADVVTADAERVTVSESRHPELFWALRGGGGIAGVVTSFEFALHPVGSRVLAGSLVYPHGDFEAVARRYHEFVADAPPTCRTLLGSMVLPTASYLPEAVHDRRVAILISCHTGDPAAGRSVLRPLREGGEPLMDSIRERSYRAWQRAGESRGRRRTYVRSQFVEPLTDGAIRTVAERGSDTPGAGATVFVSPRGCAETAPASDATAYPHRSPAHHVLAEARWTDPERDDAYVDWVRGSERALGPHATGGVALNFLMDDEPRSRVLGAFGDNHGRLVEVKSAWDPAHRFRMNPHVRPEG